MLKIYGANLSTPANKVRFVANELGLDYEYIQVKIREGEHRKKEFLSLNPAGKIPVIDDDGIVLFESNAIAKYLVKKHRSSLYPSDLEQQAIVDQWIDFATFHVNAAMNRIVFNRIFANFAKVPVDERSLEDGLKFLGRFLPVVNDQLKKTSYIAGGDFSLADIVLLAALDPAEAAQVDMMLYEHIKKWRTELMQKDFYTKCHKNYTEVLQQVMAPRT